MGIFISPESKKRKVQGLNLFFNAISNNIGLQKKSMKFSRLLNISLAIFVLLRTYVHFPSALMESILDE